MLENFDYTSPRLRNLIPTNDLMRFIALKRIENALRQSWGPDTVAQFERDGWSSKVPAFGQCTVTALVIGEYFGGEILKDPSNDHYWNILDDGAEVDLSRQQFPGNTTLRAEDRRRTRDYMLDNLKAREIMLPERYELLFRSVNDLLANDLVFQWVYKIYLFNESLEVDWT